MQTLSSAERQALRGQAHALHPVVTISEKGLSETVLKEIDRCLIAHELIKIRVFNDQQEEREACLNEICARLGVVSIQHIGKILVVYRARPEKPLPKESSIKPRQSVRDLTPRRLINKARLIPPRSTPATDKRTSKKAASPRGGAARKRKA